MNEVHELKAALLNACSLIKRAHNAGYIVNFSIQTDNLTGDAKITVFQVLKEVKVDN